MYALYVCIPCPLATLCGTSDAGCRFVPVKVNKWRNQGEGVSIQTQGHTETGIRHPAGTSEILIRPSLYFPSTDRHCGRVLRQSPGLFSPAILAKPVMGYEGAVVWLLRLLPTTVSRSPHSSKLRMLYCLLCAFILNYTIPNCAQLKQTRICNFEGDCWVVKFLRFVTRALFLMKCPM